MALQQYARVKISVGSNELFEASNITIRRSTNATPVQTFRGFVGVTPGACQTELTVDQMVPSTGFLLSEGAADPGNWMLDLNPNRADGGSGTGVVEFSITLGNGTVYNFSGFVMEDTLQYSGAGSNASVSFSAIGDFTKTWNG